MKTKGYSPGWTTCLLLASFLGMLAWCGADWWLEPRPVWIRSGYQASRHFQPTSYEPERKLLVGLDFTCDQANTKGITDTLLHVLDTHTGTSVAQLNVGSIRYEGRNRHQLNYYPHIAGDLVFRFNLREENGQEIVELRSWAYASDCREKIVRSWKVNLSNWWVQWNTHDASKFLIIHHVPCLTNYFGLVDPLPGLGKLLSLVGTTTDHQCMTMCESWAFDPSTDSLRQHCVLPLPAGISALAQVSALPDMVVYYKRPDSSGSQVFLTNTRTGSTETLPFIDPKNWLNVRSISNTLLLLHRDETEITKGPSGSPSISLESGPTPKSKVHWSLEEWRPLFDLKLKKQLRWPSVLDTNIVGSDYLTVDQMDPTRFLYQSEVDLKRIGATEYLFKLVSLIDGELKLTASWKNNTIVNVSMLKFSNQLLATVDEIVFPQEYYRWIPSTPWIQNLIHWFVPEQQRSVALIDETNGKILWKRLHREILNIAGITERMNRDFLMMVQHNYEKMPAVNVKTYECWALPIVIYSHWWARFAGVLVLAIVLIVLRRQHMRTSHCLSSEIP